MKTIIYLDYEYGKDNNPGTTKKLVKTLEKALKLSSSIVIGDETRRKIKN